MAIYFDYIITVKDNEAMLDKPIYLYQGNRNIDYYFTIREAPFKFSQPEGENIIEKLSPTHAAVTLLRTSDKVEVGTGKAEVLKDKIKLTITKEMIDETVEVGKYTMVIDLLDDEKDSIATLPPIVSQFEILPRVTSLNFDSSNIVNEAVVGQAMITGDTGPLDIFDSQGNYIKTVWLVGDKISKERLGKVESAIYETVKKTIMLPTEKKTTVLDNKSPIGKVEDLYNLPYDVFEDSLFYQTLSTVKAPNNITVKATYDNAGIETTEEFVLMASGAYGSNPNMKEYSGEFVGADNGKYIQITVAPFYESDTGEINKTVISFHAFDVATDTPITNTVKKATITLDVVEKQLDDKYLASMNYDKLFNIPYDIENLNRGFSHVLKNYQMLGLYENIFTLKDCLSSFALVNKYPDNVPAPIGRDNTVTASTHGDITMYVQSKCSEGGKGIHFVIPPSTAYFMYFFPGEDIVYELVKKTGTNYEKVTCNNFTGEDVYKEYIDNPFTNMSMDVWAIFSYKDEYVDPGKSVQNLTVYDATKFLSKRDIPTKTSQLTNDSNFLTEVPAIPVASDATIGGIKVGDGLNIVDGRLNVKNDAPNREIKLIADLTIDASNSEAIRYEFTREQYPDIAKCEEFIICTNSNLTTSKPWVMFYFNSTANKPIVECPGNTNADVTICTTLLSKHGNIVKGETSGYYNKSLEGAISVEMKRKGSLPIQLNEDINKIIINSYMPIMGVGGYIKIWGY